MKKNRFISIIGLGAILFLVSCKQETSSSTYKEEDTSSSASSKEERPSSTSSKEEDSSSESKESSIETEGYYKGIDWSETGATLKTALFNVISKDTVAVGYKNLWSAYAKTDVKEDGTIWDMYSNIEYDPVAGHANAGSYKKEGDAYNREHTIPQSSWKTVSISSTIECDLFHVYPTDAYVNNKRANYPHGNVSKATYTSGNGSKLGTGDNYGYTKTVFEIVDEYKGDFARTYFYFATRYENYISSMSYDAFSGNTYPSLSSWAIKTFLEWNKNDPVSEKEIKRNEAVYAIQKNRNPFIDHPEIAEQIWSN